MRRLLVTLLAAGVSLGLAATAAALCACGDRDGCSSFVTCAGGSPGDACGRNSSCKISVGSAADPACCCGCTRGIGPTGCNYGAAGTLDLPRRAACGSTALGRLATEVATAVNAQLAQADAACREAGNPVGKARAARDRLARLRKKVARAAARSRIDRACADDTLSVIDAMTARIDDVEAGGGAGGPTTTTLPPVPSCAASFAGTADPAEVEFQVGCWAAGTSYQGFQVTLDGGRTVTNFLQPSGFTCTIATESATHDSLRCTGDFNVDVPVTGGRLQTDPAPAPAMEASLFVQVGDGRYGPFATTGP